MHITHKRHPAWNRFGPSAVPIRKTVKKLRYGDNARRKKANDAWAESHPFPTEMGESINCILWDRKRYPIKHSNKPKRRGRKWKRRIEMSKSFEFIEIGSREPMGW